MLCNDCANIKQYVKKHYKMQRFHVSIVIKTRTMTLFSGKIATQFRVVFWEIYTTDKNFTRPPVPPVPPNINSVCYASDDDDDHHHHDDQVPSLQAL